MLVGLPLLVAAFSVARPTPLPRAFLPAFDGEATKTLAKDAARPFRLPGSLATADWFRAQLQPYGLPIRTERFSAVIPGRGRVELQNIVAEAVGPSPGTIVVMAHRDNDGRGPGANDNASGTAMLIQLARTYGAPPRAALRPAAPEPHDPLSLDGWGRVRRRRRRLVRGSLPISQRHRRSHQPGLGRRQRAHPARVRRRHSSRALGNLPADDRGTHRGANRAAACSAERAAPTDRSRLPLLAVRAGAVPRAGHRGRHAHDCG